jgi:phospholipid/cholesterol/gamma-HCH transport system substrate-binding protein
MNRFVRAIAIIVTTSLLSACALVGGSGDPDVVAYFEDVGDLVVAGQVQVNDIEVGRVTAIDLVMQDGNMLAKVSMTLDDDVEVPANDLAAVVRQTSLLGEQFVQLFPGTEAPPMVGDETVTIPVERTDRRVDVETFLADLSGLIGDGGLEDLNRFTHAQALILEDRGRRFGETIEGLADLTDVLAARRGDLGDAIDSLASASTTLADNKDTLGSFLDSLHDANALLADRSESFQRLLSSLRRFGTVNSRFLAQHEDAINRGFRALRPILAGLAGAQRELRIDIEQLRMFFELFPNSFGGGPGDRGAGDYIQVEAVLCEVLTDCHTSGEKGDVKGEGS